MLTLPPRRPGLAGCRDWLWSVVGPCATLFAVRTLRSQTVVQERLGETFAGVVGSDVLAANFSFVETCRLGRDAHIDHHQAITAHFHSHTAPQPVINNHESRCARLPAIFPPINRPGRVNGDATRSSAKSRYLVVYCNRNLRNAGQTFLTGGSHRSACLVHLDPKLPE
jgi:hypothetical protein